MAEAATVVDCDSSTAHYQYELCRSVHNYANQSAVSNDNVTVENLFIVDLLQMVTNDQVLLALISVGGLTNLLAALVMARLVVRLRRQSNNRTLLQDGRSDGRSDLAGVYFIAACYYANSIVLLCVLEGYDWAQQKLRFLLEFAPQLQTWCCKLWQYLFQVLRGLSSWAPLLLLWLQLRAERHVIVTVCSGRSLRFRANGFHLGRCLLYAMLVLLAVLNVHSLWLYDSKGFSCGISSEHAPFFTRVWPFFIQLLFSTLPSLLMLLLAVRQLVFLLHAAIYSISYRTQSSVLPENQPKLPTLLRASRRLAWVSLIQRTVFDFPCETANAVLQAIPNAESDNYIMVTATVIFIRLATMLCYVTAPVCLLCDAVYRKQLRELCVCCTAWQASEQVELSPLLADLEAASQQMHSTLRMRSVQFNNDCNANNTSTIVDESSLKDSADKECSQVVRQADPVDGHHCRTPEVTCPTNVLNPTP